MLCGSRTGVSQSFHALDGGVATRAWWYCHTQTGQLREVTDALTAPLVENGWIRTVDVQPRVAFPFPWPIRRFFGVFPASVDPDALVELADSPTVSIRSPTKS